MTCPECGHSDSDHQVDVQAAPQLVFLLCREPGCRCAKGYRLDRASVTWELVTTEWPSGGKKGASARGTGS
jgi:hypothetical protein